MRNTTILALIIVLGTMVCFADGWQRTYGGTNGDGGKSVVQTSDGGYIIAGYTDSFGDGDYDMYLVKTDAIGDTEWTRTYGGSDNDCAYSVEQTIDGGYILAGYSGPYDYHDVYIVKTTSTGDVQWTKTYGGVQNDEAYSVMQTADGGYFVAGYSESFDDGAWGDVYVLKLNSSGDTVWTHTYGGIDVDIAYSAKQTTDGGYILAGYTNSFYTGSIYLIKITAFGDVEWSQNYDGDVAYSVAQTSDGGYILAGWIDYADYDIYIIKTNSSGDIEWTKIYGGSDEEDASSIINTADGGFLVVGYTMSFGAGDEDVYILKLNSSGDTIWTRTYGGSDDDEAYSVMQTSDGGYIIAGYTYSFGAGYDDIYLIKTDSLGEVSWVSEPNIKPQDINISAYPNPFNSSVKITAPADAEIEIYDVKGNVVYKPPLFSNSFLPEEKGEPMGAQSQSPSPWGEGYRMRGLFIWMPDKTVSSGIYLVRITSEDGLNQTKRIVYLK